MAHLKASLAEPELRLLEGKKRGNTHHTQLGKKKPLGKLEASFAVPLPSVEKDKLFPNKTQHIQESTGGSSALPDCYHFINESDDESLSVCNSKCLSL